jgi:hypothetical protein
MLWTWKAATVKLLFLLALLILIAGLAGFRNLGRWLISEDSLSPADVISVLSGGMPPAEEAAKDLSEGAMPPRCGGFGIRYVGEDGSATRTGRIQPRNLVHEGVPEAVVHILPNPVRSITGGEGG